MTADKEIGTATSVFAGAAGSLTSGMGLEVGVGGGVGLAGAATWILLRSRWPSFVMRPDCSEEYDCDIWPI